MKLTDPTGADEAGAEWDRRYAAVPQLFSRQPDEALVELVSPLPAGRALDLGAGEGRNSLWLAQKGWEVVAVDASGVALGRLRTASEADSLAISTVHADLDDFLSHGATFDLVLLAYMHPDPSQRQALFDAASAAVSDGGHLLLVGHHLDCLGVAGPPDPARLYTEAILRDGFPRLELQLLELRTRSRPDEPSLVDVVMWAAKP